MVDSREFNIIVLGATGFTGQLVAKHLAQHAPTTLKWAIAGRSQQKLEQCKESLAPLLANRKSPGIVVVDSMNYDDCVRLVKRTTCLMTTVGPYARLGEAVLKACALNGTHYCDLTGEIPFVRKMMKLYEAEAKQSGSVLICCAGFDSIPVDLSNYLVADYIKKNYHSGTKDAKTVLCDVRGGVSGGTLASVLTLLDTFSLKDIGESHAPWSISPRKGSAKQGGTPHVRWDADVNMYCASWVGDAVDRSVAGRSWGLLDYGSSWTTYGYVGITSWALAYAYITMLYIGGAMVGVPPIRWALQRLVTQPGSGPSQKQMDDGKVLLKAFGSSDSDVTKRASATFELDADPGYKGTALMLSCGK